MPPRLEIFYPTKPYNAGQGFGQNRACSNPDTTGVVGELPNGTCPPGKVKLYPLLGLKGHPGKDAKISHRQPIYSSVEGYVRELEEERQRGLMTGVVTGDKFSMDEYGIHYAKKIDCHYDEIVVKLHQYVRIGELLGYGDNSGLSSGDHNHEALKPVEYYPNSNVTYNVFQTNGFFGAIDFSKFQNGKYAEDYDNFSYSFQFDLKFGDEGPEVELLQTALQILGFFPKDHPLTLFYGSITRNAVWQFQIKYGIAYPFFPWLTPGYGRCGPATRRKLNLLFQEA
jgi:hypothetical protein